ncbi:MAG: hypothetical protein V1888_00910 [archaeon]
MKNIFNLLMGVLVLGLAGFALAESTGVGAGGSSDDVVSTGFQEDYGQLMLIGTETGNKGEGSELQNRIQVQDNVRSGNFESSDGKQIQIKESASNRVELNVGGARAETGLQLDSKDVGGKAVLSAKLSNGKDSEIKIMPDTASERAIERLQLKVCNEEAGCQIELKEVGEGNEARLAYEVKAQKTSRVFGLFKKDMQVEAQVDAESGEVIQSNKPWWAFLASESEE